MGNFKSFLSTQSALIDGLVRQPLNISWFTQGLMMKQSSPCLECRYKSCCQPDPSNRHTRAHKTQWKGSVTRWRWDWMASDRKKRKHLILFSPNTDIMHSLQHHLQEYTHTHARTHARTIPPDLLSQVMSKQCNVGTQHASNIGHKAWANSIMKPPHTNGQQPPWKAAHTLRHHFAVNKTRWCSLPTGFWSINTASL